MSFSIPKTIIPNYTTCDTLPSGLPQIGTAIKDLPPGAETAAKKAHSTAVTKLREQFVSDTERYNHALNNANVRADAAEKVISNERWKKVAAITALVATIIGIVGAIVATAITGTLPLLAIAIPFTIALVPSSYYTHIFRLKVSDLENDIAAPKQLQAPTLHLPTYYPSDDLDLKQSRIDAQNAMAAKSTLQQFANSPYSPERITGYALLGDKTPSYYARCLQLSHIYNTVIREKQGYTSQATQEVAKLKRELESWKSKEDSFINSQEWALANREIVRPRKPVPGVIHAVGNVLTRFQLDNRKSEIATNYAKRSADIQTWYSQTMQNISSAYDKAISSLERQFAAAA